MGTSRTESRHEAAAGLDQQPAEAALRVLAEAQVAAAEAVRGAVPALARASELVAERLAGGGRLAYAAAGSSALMALADALELPGTFGIPRDRVVMLIAGGRAALETLAGGPEDDAEQGARDVADAALGGGDVLVCVAASGSTPYTLGAQGEARRRDVATIAMANNAGAPLLLGADQAVLLPTPPEIVAGSTRMGAGTAQKIALNMLSTLAAIRLGHVHDGYMVNLHADNAKLRRRAEGIVSAISGRSESEAARLLDLSGGLVKHAVLLSAGAADLDEAQTFLDGAGQSLRRALSGMNGSARSPANQTRQG